MREICNGFSEISQLWILRMFSRDLNFSEIAEFLCLFSYVVIHVSNAGHLVLFCLLVAVDATKIKMNGQALLGMLPESSSRFTFLRNAHRGCTRIHPHLFYPDPWPLLCCYWSSLFVCASYVSHSDWEEINFICILLIIEGGALTLKEPIENLTTKASINLALSKLFHLQNYFRDTTHVGPVFIVW